MKMYDNADTSPPLLTILSLCYNHEPYLRECLESVIMQKTNFRFEMLIGEDCSPDSSKSILQEYETKYPHIFKVIYRDVNIGAAKNHYDLINRIKSKYFIILETDDYWTDPFKLQLQVDFLEANPEFYGVTHDFSEIDEEGNMLVESALNGSFYNQRLTANDLIYSGKGFHTTTRMLRNFMLDGGDKLIEQDIYMIGDAGMFLMVLLRFGDMFVIGRNMSVHRNIRRLDGTSYQSSTIQNPDKSSYEHFHYFKRINGVLNDDRIVHIQYNYMKSHLMRKVLGKTKSLTWKTLFRMFKEINVKWRILFLYRIIINTIKYPVRKIRKKIRGDAK